MPSRPSRPCQLREHTVVHRSNLSILTNRRSMHVDADGGLNRAYVHRYQPLCGRRGADHSGRYALRPQRQVPADPRARGRRLGDGPGRPSVASEALFEFHSSPLADLFWFHRTLDTLDATDSNTVAAMLLAGLIVTTVVAERWSYRMPTAVADTYETYLDFEADD